MSRQTLTRRLSNPKGVSAAQEWRPQTTNTLRPSAPLTRGSAATSAQLSATSLISTDERDGSDASALSSPSMSPSQSYSPPHSPEYASVEMFSSLPPPPSKTQNRIKINAMFLFAGCVIGGIVACVILGIQGKL